MDTQQHIKGDRQQVKQDLLAHLKAEHAKAEIWAARNDNDSFPEASESHRQATAKWKGFIELVESLEP